jgi:hypothetical protein
MTPKHITLYKMAVPPAQFPLIAHFVKWLTVPEDVELSKGYMILDGQKYTDGLPMSYMMQVHDILMMRPVSAIIGANLMFHGVDVRMWIRVDEYFATLWFEGKDKNESSS